MKSTLKTLKLLADPTRLRIINVLNEESLSLSLIHISEPTRPY
mgnify:CR=1 FL=1